MPRLAYEREERLVLRKIIRIDEGKCNGCGLCIPNCVEGALQIVDGKARLIKEEYCDGLGACLGKCPQGAITIEERESEEFDRDAVEERLKRERLVSQPYSIAQEPSLKKHAAEEATKKTPVISESESALTHWPIQITLASPRASFLDGADLLITADCAPFCYPNFHTDFLKGKALLIGCPKLDDVEFYKEKLASIFRQSSIRSVTVINMEVPCCFGLHQVVREALAASGKNIPLKQEIISIKGNHLPPHALQRPPFIHHHAR